jgi:hypothetical protein
MMSRQMTGRIDHLFGTTENSALMKMFVQEVVVQWPNRKHDIPIKSGICGTFD